MSSQPRSTEYERFLVDELRGGRMTRRDVLRGALAGGASLGALSTILSACGASASDDDSLRILATGEPYGTALKKVAADWGKQEGIDVKVDQLAYGQAYERMVLLGRSGSTDYDMQVMDCIWVPTFTGNRWIANLEQVGKGKDVSLDLDAYVPGAVDAYSRDENGTLFSIPITFGMEINAYRKDIYERAGFAGAPATWSELNEDVLPKIHDLESGVAGIVSMPNEQDATYSEWTIRLMGDSLPPNSRQFVWSNDFEPVFQIDDRSTQAIAEWLAVKPYAQRGVNEAGYAEGIQAFAQGKAATMMNWVVFFGDFEAEGTATAGKLAYTLPPWRPGASEANYYIGTFQLAINEASDKKDPAYALMSYLTSAEGQQKMLDAGQPDPYLAGPYQESRWIERYPWFEPMWEARGQLVPLNTGVKEYVELQRVVYEELQSAWFGRAEPQQVNESLVAKVGSFFEERGYA